MWPSATCASASVGSSSIAFNAAAFDSEIASTQKDPSDKYESARPAYASAYFGSVLIACCKYSIDCFKPATVP